MKRLVGIFGMCGALLLSALAGVAPAHAAGCVNWHWSHSSGYAGTLVTNGTLQNGAAASGRYIISQFTLTSTRNPSVEIGSTADGTYALRDKPAYQYFIWDGATKLPSEMGRWQNGETFTNGFGISNGPGDLSAANPRGAYVIMGIDFLTIHQSVLYGANFLDSPEPIRLTPRKCGVSDPPRSAAVTHPATGVARITWIAPVSFGGHLISRYEYCRSACSKTKSWKSAGSTGGAPNKNITISKLKKNRKYTIKIRAVNAAGKSRVLTLKFPQVR